MWDIYDPFISIFKFSLDLQMCWWILTRNFQNTFVKNPTAKQCERKNFGLILIGDRATIEYTLLLNMMALCDSIPPTIVSILDCIEYKTVGKKDERYIMENISRRNQTNLIQTPVGLLFPFWWCFQCSNCQCQFVNISTCYAFPGCWISSSTNQGE